MKNNLMFSVIIPLYNKEKYIKRAVKSVLNQTFQNFEIIIVNDGSTDNSLAISKKIKDSRIRIFSQKNLGVSNARNFGIKKAKGKYISFLDADDEQTPQFLETIYNLILKYKTCHFFGTAFKRVCRDNSQHCTVYGKKKDCIVKNFIAQISKTGKFFIHISSIIVKKTVFDDVGYFFSQSNNYNSGTAIGEDFDLWIRISCKYNLVYSNYVGCIYYTNTPINTTIGYGFQKLDCASYENTIQKLITNTKSKSKKNQLEKLLYRLRNISVAQLLIRGYFKKAKKILDKQKFKTKEVTDMYKMINIQTASKHLKSQHKNKKSR